MTDVIKQIDEALEAHGKGILNVSSAGHTYKCSWEDNDSPEYDDEIGHNQDFKCTCGAESLDTKTIEDTIKAALTVLQRIASGEDWFETFNVPTDMTEVCVKYGEGGDVSTTRYAKDSLVTSTHWKHLDQAKHIAVLMEQELNK